MSGCKTELASITWLTQSRLTVVLNGLVRITAPAPVRDATRGLTCPADRLSAGRTQPETRMAYAMPGTVRSSLLIAADLHSSSTIAGHFTEFPSDEATVLVQVPFVDNRAPQHTVLYEGPCI